MRFWDSSAIVAMLAAQGGSETMLELLREDLGMVVWWGTVLECRVAVNRLRDAATSSGFAALPVAA